eukprot:TRINITY_DN1236_c0_g1_i10.p1 TRINITY_DN1236_c0_g1~~TRINITY_DN1236_c0_g1_i10.p1  ORF type:complete len:178 (-),score=22.85 TRINITY_DN1236_c0_g1_i10:113-646(-)
MTPFPPAFYFPPPTAFSYPFPFSYPYPSPGSVPGTLPTPPAEVVPKKEEKKKDAKKPKMLRVGGGQIWEDDSLLAWPKDDFRIFAGNLGNEVTDEALKRAFSQYKSVVKTRVIRDKRTGKSKGFGFISFMDPQEFVKALREMNGKYICNRPCKLTKSRWAERNLNEVKKKGKGGKDT